MFCNHYPPQSPIDLEQALPLRCQLPEDAVILDWSNPGQGQLQSTEHGPEIVFKKSNATATVRLPGYPTPVTFTLSKFHFHSQSEHQVNGQCWPLEVHIVHSATEPKPWNPREHHTIYAAIAVFIKPTVGKKGKKKANEFFEGVVKHLRGTNLNELPAGKAIGVKQVYDPKLLLPFVATTPFTQVPYWRYEGALTTKVNQANDGYVSWIVLKQPLEVDPECLKEMLELKHAVRLPQLLDRRFVIFSPGPVTG